MYKSCCIVERETLDAVDFWLTFRFDTSTRLYKFLPQTEIRLKSVLPRERIRKVGDLTSFFGARLQRECEMNGRQQDGRTRNPPSQVPPHGGKEREMREKWETKWRVSFLPVGLDGRSPFWPNVAIYICHNEFHRAGVAFRSGSSNQQRHIARYWPQDQQLYLLVNSTCQIPVELCLSLPSI